MAHISGQLVEMLPEAVFETNRNLELNYANRCAFELFGYSAEDLKGGLNGLELIAPADRDRAKANVARRLKGEDPGTVEYQALRKDGSSFPILLHSSSIIKEGELFGFRGILLDITERKRAEEALRESEEKYRTLFESSRDAIMTLAPPTWLFTSGNSATVELFKVRDEAEFISLGPWQLSPERQPDGKLSDEKAKEMIETAMHNGSHFFEWTHCHSNGTPFPAEVLLTRMEQRGKVLLQATVRNITERKQAEEELKKHRDHLEELVKERTKELQILIDTIPGREVRMAELKKVIKKLRSQLEGAGMKPVADDPWKKAGKDYT